MIDSNNEVAAVGYANDFGRRAAVFRNGRNDNRLLYFTVCIGFSMGWVVFFQTVWFGFEGDRIEALRLLRQNEIIVMSNDGRNGDGIIGYFTPYGKWR